MSARQLFGLIGVAVFLIVLKLVSPMWGRNPQAASSVASVQAAANAPLWQSRRFVVSPGQTRCVLNSIQSQREFALVYEKSFDSPILVVSGSAWFIPQAYMVRIKFELDGVQEWSIVGGRTANGAASTAKMSGTQIRFALGNLSLAQSLVMEIPEGNAVREINAPPLSQGVMQLRDALAPERFTFAMIGAASAIDDWVSCVESLPGAEQAVWLDSHVAQHAIVPEDGSFSRWRSYVDQTSDGQRMCSSIAEAQGPRAVRIAVLPDRSVVLHLMTPDWAQSFEDGTQFEVFFSFTDETPRIYRAQKTGPYVSVFLAAGDTSAGHAPGIAADDFLRKLSRDGGFRIGFSAVLQLPAWQVTAPGNAEAATWLHQCLGN